MIATDEHLGHYFKKLHFLMEQTMNRRLLELDLTSAQGHVIGFLTHSSEPPCARDMEMKYSLSHATVSGILSRMEDKGFIEIRPDIHDRRVKRIFLLEKGTACSKELRQRIDESEQLITRGFTPEELTQFRGFLQRAAQNLGAGEMPDPTNREE